ncbi:TauD/TfdA dioxygenase family protein [Paenibacillus pini]|nr:TauD/TfdA family dioxygenase [Paenibacillus pini]
MSQVATYLSRSYIPKREHKVGAHLLQRLPEGVQDRPYTLFRLKPLSPIIGAEIDGVDLGKPIPPELKEELHRAFLEWKVIFFRNQNISSAEQLAFARLWGGIERHPFLPQGSVEEVTRFEKNEKAIGMENTWHTDVTWRLKPALGSVLRLSEVPPQGGDTLWADMAAAYDNLPEEVKVQIDGLTAIHDFTGSFGRGLTPEQLVAKQEEYPAAEHPVVRIHPETGRKTLFVNAAFTVRIIGLEAEESEKLLQYLFKQAHVPEYQVRFHWEKNSVAFWDNRATQHYAVSDYYPNRRIAERISIEGDLPE